LRLYCLQTTPDEAKMKWTASAMGERTLDAQNGYLSVYCAHLSVETSEIVVFVTAETERRQEVRTKVRQNWFPQPS